MDVCASGAGSAVLGLRGAKGLLPAAASAKVVGVVLCIRTGPESSTQEVAGRRLLSLALPEGSKAGWGLLPASKVRVPPVGHSRTAVAVDSPSEFKGMAGALSLSVPEGTKVVWGLLPAAKLPLSSVRCTGSVAGSQSEEGEDTTGELPSSRSFVEDFYQQLDAISLQMNCVALVGHQDILDDIAETATRTINVVAELTPALVAMVSDRALIEFFPRVTFYTDNQPLQGGNLVDYIERSALDIVTAVETVRLETTQGYVREDTLVSAILKVRGPASFISKEKLAPPYAGAVSPAAKADSAGYFRGLARELREICAILEMALVNDPKA